ncbi:MAG: hypothetical protein ACE5FD_13795, partial [Anaerolineae bacterium]
MSAVSGKRLAVISEGLHWLATGWVTLAGVVVFVLFVSLVLPRVAGGGAADVDTPDLMLFYAADRLYQVAEALGADGRTAYIRVRFTFDVAWP